MTKFLYDEFAKEYLVELCQDYGETVSSADVKSERRQVDILFTPKPNPNNSPSNTLGLLGKMLVTSCLLEIYRNGIQPDQILECINKLIDVKQNKIRAAKREKNEKKLPESPILWIITPTISDNILPQFCAIFRHKWGDGIYFLPEGFMTRIIAVHQLPVNPETLWLRILGKGKVQADAITEFKSLPENFPYRENILELIYGLLETLQQNQQKSQTLDTQDLEVVMNLRKIFRERLAQEKQEGIQENLRDNIISILEKRFESVPFELIDLINSICDTQELQRLHLETISVNSLTEFQNLIN